MKLDVVTDERCTGYHFRGHPERPARITRTVDALKEQKDIEVEWLAPAPVTEASLLRAHTKEHLEVIRRAAADFDGDTPATPEIFQHAERSVGAGLKALESARKKRPVFSLIRPPGHHATRSKAMGFCYLSSVAILALEALATGYERVAVFDFDVHHGNGTEDVLLNVPGARFFSIHQHPCYPGTGTADVGKNCFNFPLAPRTPRPAYRETLRKAMDGMMAGKPGLILVSAGFDAYARDPLAQETLEAEDFQWIGENLRGCGVPLVSVLEGGYSLDLPQLILAYLKGITGK